MKNFKLFTLAAGLLASSSAMADTYSTVVNVADVADSLAWEETTQMKFPQIVLDALSVPGHNCHSNSSNSAYNNQLCPDKTGRTAAVFAVSGLANATVLVNLDTTAKVIEGLEFVPASTNQTTLNSNGQSTVGVSGLLTLQDRALVVSNTITFTYDLEFTAQ